MMTRIASSPVIWVGVIVGGLLGAAQYAAGNGVGSAVLGAAIPIGYALVVTVLGRRSSFSSALAGRPVDERWEHINLEATALALGISAAVVVGAVAVALASGGDWKPYAFIGAVMAAGYLVALIVIEQRH
jgi:Ca2+/Na+ antiporter